MVKRLYTIVVANQKGGVGKSTACLALTAYLQRNNYKTLLVDLDAQGNCTSCYNGSKTGNTITDVLQGKIPAKQAIIKTPAGDLIAANIRLATENPLDGKPLTTLKDALAPLKADYDFCVIDTAPDLSNKLTNALIAADGVIVPVLADIWAIESLDLFMLSFNACKKKNRKLTLLGLLVSCYDGRAIVSQNNLETLKEKAAEYNTRVFKAVIRKTATVKEAQNLYNPDLFEYAPKATATKDYWQAFNELQGVINYGK